MLPVLRTEHEAARESAAKALARAEAIERIIDGIERLLGEAPSPTLPLFDRTEAEATDGPRGQEAVRQVMATQPDRIWTLSAITREVRRRRWINPNAKTPQAAIRAATQRLAGAGLAEKIGAGRYRLTEAGIDAKT